jgi:hypothetical protein
MHYCLWNWISVVVNMSKLQSYGMIYGFLLVNWYLQTYLIYDIFNVFFVLILHYKRCFCRIYCQCMSYHNSRNPIMNMNEVFSAGR